MLPAAALSAALLSALAGCGGGSGDGSGSGSGVSGGAGGGGEPVSQPGSPVTPPQAGAPVQNPVLTGTAAVGAPLAGADVTVIDAAGTTRTTKAAADGTWTIDATGLTAPLLVRAVAELGETTVSLVAVKPSSVAIGSHVVNVTPLTHAAAALVAGADAAYNPEALASPAALAALRPDRVRAAQDALIAAVAPVLAQAGVNTAGLDLLSTPFAADRSGMDRVLDAVSVTVRADGVQLINRTVPLSESDSTASPSEVRLSLAGGAAVPAPAVGTTGALQAGTLPALSALDTLAAAIRQCFALPVGERIANGTPSPACSAHVDPGYLQSSYSYAERWAGMLGAAALTGATFEPPVLRATFDGGLMLVNFNYRDAEGTRYTRPEVVKLDDQGKALLWGNRRPMDLVVEQQVHRSFTFANGVDQSRLELRLRFGFNPLRVPIDRSLRQAPNFNASDVACVIVTGPLLPAGGVMLKTPASGAANSQDYMAIHARYDTAPQTAAYDASAPLDHQIVIGATATPVSYWTKVAYDCGITAPLSVNPNGQRFVTRESIQQFTYAAQPLAGSSWTYSMVPPQRRFATQGVSREQIGTVPQNPAYSFRVVYKDAFNNGSGWPANTVPTAAQVQRAWDPGSQDTLAPRLVGKPIDLETAGRRKFAALADETVQRYLRAGTADGDQDVSEFAVKWTVPDAGSAPDSFAILKNVGRGLVVSSHRLLRGQREGVFRPAAAVEGFGRLGSEGITSVYRELSLRSYDDENVQLSTGYASSQSAAQ